MRKVISIVTLPAICLLLSQCKKSGFSTSDFEGKTFKAKIRIDSAKTIDPMAAGLMAGTTLQFRFDKSGKGLYRAEVGSMSTESPFDWSVKNDSLFVTNTEDQQTNAYALNAGENGILLDAGSATFDLVEEK